MAGRLIHGMKGYRTLPRTPGSWARSWAPRIECLVPPVSARTGRAVEAQVEIAVSVRRNVGPVGQCIATQPLIAPLRESTEHVVGIHPTPLRLSAHVAELPV